MEVPRCDVRKEELKEPEKKQIKKEESNDLFWKCP